MPIRRRRVEFDSALFVRHHISHVNHLIGDLLRKSGVSPDRLSKSFLAARQALRVASLWAELRVHRYGDVGAADLIVRLTARNWRC
jgi:hypothetical protein